MQELCVFEFDHALLNALLADYTSEHAHADLLWHSMRLCLLEHVRTNGECALAADDAVDAIATGRLSVVAVKLVLCTATAELRDLDNC
jgi:hypothetical protein